MRRYILSGASAEKKLVLENCNAPGAPGPGEVLVDMKAASLNFRDFLITSGMYPMPTNDGIIPVSDGAGEVAAVGEGVSTVATGDRVMTTFFPNWAGGQIEADLVGMALGGSVDGILAEQVILPASSVMPIPKHFNYEEAATLPCAAVTAWNALVDTGGIKAGDTVLVQGTGGVSSFALQFAKMFGATVIQTSSSDEKLAAAKERGADHLINYSSTPEWDVEARRITNGRGVDIVVEVGGAGTLERSMRAVRLGGTVATVGLLSGVGTIDPLPLISGVVKIAGVFVGSHEMAAAMVRAIESSDMHPVIDKVFPFEEAPAAFTRLTDGTATSGKIVITI